jgi:hypothetical protein
MLNYYPAPPLSHFEFTIRNEHGGIERVVHHLDVVDTLTHAGNTLTRCESASIKIQRINNMTKTLPPAPDSSDQNIKSKFTRKRILYRSSKSYM